MCDYCDHGWQGTTEEGPIWCDECPAGVQGALNTLSGWLWNIVECMKVVRHLGRTPWEESWHSQLRGELRAGLVKRRQLKRRLRALEEAT